MNEGAYIHVRDASDFENAVSMVFPIEIRTYYYLPCFVRKNAIPKEVKLPNDFFINEFMELDSDDVDALLEFQNKWGYIESFHDTLHMKAWDFGKDSFRETFERIGYKEEYQEMRMTHTIRESAYRTEVDGDADSFEITEEMLEMSSAVNVDEARICVKNAQLFINALVDAAQYGIVEDLNSNQYLLVTEAIRQMQEAINRYFPPIELISPIELRSRNSRVPLIPLVYAQCLSGIQTNQRGSYVFRICRLPGCGRRILLGRKGSGAQAYTPRRNDSAFCCTEHQRLYGKHKRGKDGKWDY